MARTKTESDELPPHNDEAERAVVGTLITDTDAVVDECVRVTKGNGDFFFDIRNRAVFEAALGLSSAGKPVDTVTLKTYMADHRTMEKVGIDYLGELTDSAMPASGITYWLDILRENFMARGLIRECVTTQQSVTSANALEELAGHTQRILSLGDSSTDAECSSGTSLAQSLIDYLEARYQRHLSGKATGVVSGWIDLDKYTDGFQFSEQAVVAARPSIGKTAFACGLAAQACLVDKVPILFVTLEMSKEAVLVRMLAAQGGITAKALRFGTFTKDDFKKFTGFTALVKNSPFYFVSGLSRGLSSLQIAAEVRRHVRRHGVKLVIVDYLQKIKPAQKHEKRTYEVAEVSGTLRAVAVQTGVAMVTLAQLNREPDIGKTRPPRLADLADCAQIERDADLVVLIDRNRAENRGDARFIVAKQRDGEIGVAEVWFNGTHCRFENHSKQSTTQPYKD